MNPTTSASSEKGLFPVAVKALLRDRNNLLLLHDVFGDWDLPGGRILPHEFGGDIKNVLARKIREELGNDIQYRIDSLDTYFQVTRVEHDTGKQSNIFGLGFTVLYLGGEIELGPHHDEYKWVDTAKLNPGEYLAHGWEIGVRRYLRLNGLE